MNGENTNLRNGIQSLGQLKAFYISPPGRPVHSNAISTSLGSIQPCYNDCTKTIRSHIHVSVARYSFIQLSNCGNVG